MKKTLAIFLALTMMFALVACAGNGDSAAAEKKVADFVEVNRDSLISSFSESFATSPGMTCTSSIKTEGCGFIIQTNINELEDVSDEAKALLQEAYDGIDGTFEEALGQMQTELPELEYFKIIVCEKDGDELAIIHAGE